MATYVALLRGVNVGGHAKVAMADLRAVAKDLGLADPRSLLQSGNLVFRDAGRAAPELEDLLEGAVAERLGLDTVFFVRGPEELAEVVADNPFPDEASRDSARLVVHFLRAAADAERVEALRAAISGREVVRARGRHLYAFYPDGQGRSRLTNTVIEKTLGTRATARNWNTVIKLAALALS